MSLYAFHQDVSARLHNVYPSGISSTTQPTVEQVAFWLDEAEDLTNAVLKALGMPAPYTDTQAKRILGKHVIDYTEGRVRRVLAASGGDGKNQDGVDLIQSFEKFLLDLQNRKDFWTGILAETAISESSVGSSAVVSSDNQAPWFTRETKF